MFLRDDNTRLRQMVEDAMNEMFNKREAFTTMDISKPIITKSIDDDGVANRVRHHQVRSIIDSLWSGGSVDDALFTTSSATVYPEGGQKAVTVRLFHPDDSDFDPASYTATRQTLNAGLPVTRGIQIDDVDDTDDTDDTDDVASPSTDRITVITSTVSGASVTKQCQIQPKQDSLNIPSTIVKAAGFGIGDGISIRIENDGVYVERRTAPTGSTMGGGKQAVDHECRIRLHGKNVSSLSSGSGPLTAMVVEPKGGTKYIQVQ